MIKARQITTQQKNVSKTLKRYLEELQEFEIVFITESSFKDTSSLGQSIKIHYTFFYKEKEKN